MEGWRREGWEEGQREWEGEVVQFRNPVEVFAPAELLRKTVSECIILPDQLRS